SRSRRPTAGPATTYPHLSSALHLPPYAVRGARGRARLPGGRRALAVQLVTVRGGPRQVGWSRGDRDQGVPSLIATEVVTDGTEVPSCCLQAGPGRGELDRHTRDDRGRRRGDVEVALVRHRGVHVNRTRGDVIG